MELKKLMSNYLKTYFIFLVPIIALSSMTGQAVKIAILDTEQPDKKRFGSPDCSNHDKLNSFFGGGAKFDREATKSIRQSNGQKNENKSFCLMGKKQFWMRLMQKNHGSITQALIRTVAPDVEILTIPILGKHGYANKQKLYDGLLQARQAQVDIVHMGLQIFDLDETYPLDQKIITLIQSFPYVVAPAGNHGDVIDHVGYPAAIAGVIGVGSFGQQKERYVHSRFCQATVQTPVDFIMLGENIWTSVWVDEIQNYVMMPVSGTSFSAASMTGVLALMLEKNNKHLPKDKVIELLQICSYKRDISWNGCVKYGTPAVEELLYHLQKLVSLKKKKVERYFAQLRNFISS